MNDPQSDNRNDLDIVSQYYEKIATFVHRRVHSWEDGEDILQDVFCRFASMDQTAIPTKLVLPWLFRVAQNLVINFWCKRKCLLFSEIEDEKTDEVLSWFLSDEKDQPELIHLQNIFWDRFCLALAELPLEQRDIFEWTEIQHESFRKISERTGIKINTLLSRKRYAVQYLRKQLQDIRDEFSKE
ncbi:MAG: sigma-70 family RNA polymerase sigma factor [Planctomycetaceae bacterium]|jgi:RNA polymerase sigma factor (sigma-70 family)|nr:sigma-70 family RNA polymerase sigma factor [Planctomycetaceae bacterium]